MHCAYARSIKAAAALAKCANTSEATQALRTDTDRAKKALSLSSTPHHIVAGAIDHLLCNNHPPTVAALAHFKLLLGCLCDCPKAK